MKGIQVSIARVAEEAEYNSEALGSKWAIHVDEYYEQYESHAQEVLVDNLDPADQSTNNNKEDPPGSVSSGPNADMCFKNRFNISMAQFEVSDKNIVSIKSV